MNKAAALVVPVVLFGLSGCFPTGTDGGTPDGSPAASDLEGGSTACLIDKDWQLDVNDAATKLGQNLTEKGQNVTSVSGEGQQSIFFDQEGIAGSATDLTYTVVIDMGDGISMTMTQHHEGAPGGNWAWDGGSDSTILFDDWSSDYTVTTTIAMNGTASDPTVSPANAGLGGQSMTVSCDGNTLETQASGSPFVQIWHAAG